MTGSGSNRAIIVSICILYKLLYLLTLTPLSASISPICANHKKCNGLLEHLLWPECTI